MLTEVRNGADKRAVLANGMNGSVIVMATDCERLAWDVSEEGDNVTCWEMMKDQDGPGIYLWEGTLKTYYHGLECTESTSYEGKTRKVEPHELADLLAMDVEWVVCEVCGDKHFPPACPKGEGNGDEL